MCCRVEMKSLVMMRLRWGGSFSVAQSCTATVSSILKRTFITETSLVIELLYWSLFLCISPFGPYFSFELL